jgi:hypothetical protein
MDNTMDMKKILQALDSAASKPVEGSDSMAKFLRVVKEAELNQPSVKEGFFLGVTEQDLAKDPSPAGEYYRKLVSLKTNPQWAGKEALIQKRIDDLINRLNLDKGLPTNAQGKAEPETDFNKFQTKNPTFKESQLNEGKTPHKVALPVQMAMQHYQTKKEKLEEVSVFKTYLTVVEEDIAEQKTQKEQLYRQYGKQIAESISRKNNLGK